LDILWRRIGSNDGILLLDLESLCDPSLVDLDDVLINAIHQLRGIPQVLEGTSLRAQIYQKVASGLLGYLCGKKDLICVYSFQYDRLAMPVDSGNNVHEHIRLHI